MMLSQMMTSAIYGHDLAPAVLADEKGNVVRVESAASPEWLERLLRPVRAPLHAHSCARRLRCTTMTMQSPKLHSPEVKSIHSQAIHKCCIIRLGLHSCVPLGK